MSSCCVHFKLCQCPGSGVNLWKVTEYIYLSAIFEVLHFSFFICPGWRFGSECFTCDGVFYISAWGSECFQWSGGITFHYIISATSCTYEQRCTTVCVCILTRQTNSVFSRDLNYHPLRWTCFEASLFLIRISYCPLQDEVYLMALSVLVWYLMWSLFISLPAVFPTEASKC